MANISYQNKKFPLKIKTTLIVVIEIVFIILIMAIFFLEDEKMNRRKILGFIISFLGVFTLIYREEMFNHISEDITLLSQSLVILGATLYAFAAVYGKKYKIQFYHYWY